MIDQLISSLNTLAERLEGKAKQLSDTSLLQPELDALNVIRGEACLIRSQMGLGGTLTVVGNDAGDYPSEDPNASGSILSDVDGGLDQRTNAELIAELEAMGIEIPKRPTKANLLELLANAEKGSGEENPDEKGSGENGSDGAE